MARKRSISKELQITLEGPFFERDVRRTFRQNIRTFVAAVAKEGEASVQAQLRPVSSRVAAGAKARVTSLSGRPWEVSATISPTYIYPWKNGGQRQYRGGKLAGRVPAFRRTAAAMRRARPSLAAQLIRGLE